MNRDRDIQRLGFDSDYEVRCIADTAGRSPDYEFARTPAPASPGNLVWDVGGAAGALQFEITNAAGRVWIGRACAGVGGLSGVFATPAPNVVCVVAAGDGFWIPTDHPESYQVVSCDPVKLIARVPARDLIICADFTGIAAYGPTGRCWMTKQLSWDGIDISEVTSLLIRGLAWDAPKERHVEFEVELGSGKVRGGSSPDHYRRRR